MGRSADNSIELEERCAMSEDEFIRALAEHFKSPARLFSAGNNWVLGPNNQTAEHIAKWVWQFLRERKIKL